MNRFIYLIGWVLLGSCGSAGTKKKEPDLRTEANEFIFTIINNYFKDDCKATYALFSDSLIDLSEAVLDPKPPFSDRLCQQHSKIVKDKTKTVEDYFNTYNYIIKNYSETIHSIGGESSVGTLLKPGDFLFEGIRRKPEFYSNQDFIWTSSFIFLVRKEKGQWRFKGMASD